MANMNIFGKDWTDIVFEGRNKAYGAYKLREESTKNTLLALIFGMGVIALGFASKTIYDAVFSKFASKDADTEQVEVIMVDIPDLPDPEPPVEEIKEELPPPPPEKPADASKSVQEEKAFTETVVKKDEEVKKETKTAQEDFTDKTTSGREDRAADADGDLKTKGEQTGGADKGSKGTGKGNEFSDDDNKIHNFVQQKAAPADGMQKFYTAFTRKFNAPDVGSGVNQIKVMLKFVVEKDGSFTDIQVVNDQNGAGKEAVRVLKSMPKWKPGMQNGKPVRSSFNLPITIKVAN